MIEIAQGAAHQREAAGDGRADLLAHATRRPSGSSGSSASSRRAASRWCSSPTSSTRCSRSPTGSWCCATAGTPVALDSKQGTIDQLISLMVGRDLGSFATEPRSTKPGRRGPPGGGALGRAGPGRELRPAQGRDPGRGRAHRLGTHRDGAAAPGRGPQDGGPGAARGTRGATSGARATRWRPGIGFVPEDRKVQALVLPMSVRENLTMAIHRRRQALADLPLARARRTRSPTSS